LTKQILILPGDGIGPEIVGEAIKVLNALRDRFDLAIKTDEAVVGGAAIDATGEPLPAATLDLARAADAVLLGAVGGPKWESLPIARRPEKGLLGLRSGLGLFANLRPAILYPQLADASTLKPEIASGLDILIVRELTGGIYFGQPRGVERREDGERVGFAIARKRQRRVCSVDKANVLECTELWREVATEVGAEYPDVNLSHMYVDNAAMQLVRRPKQFDVLVTTNMFGDILSDAAAMLTGSIGMLPSASLNAQGRGMYEPIHGSAPDIAGRDVANPLATILSVAMMLRYSLEEPTAADRVERAVSRVLDRGLRTADILSVGMHQVGTAAMGDAVVAALAED
jgi:3-isopropylmalate dehydrogenase